MKKFAQRYAAFLALGTLAVLCMGIVFIDNIGNFWQTITPRVRLVINSNDVVSINTNVPIVWTHLRPVEFQALPGVTNAPVIVRSPVNSNAFWEVNTAGGVTRYAGVDSFPNLTVTPSTAFNLLSGASATNLAVDSTQSGIAALNLSGTTNVTVNSANAGVVASTMASVRNITLTTTLGGGVIASINNSTQVNHSVSTGGFINSGVSGSSNLNASASNGGRAHFQSAADINLTFTANNGGNINARSAIGNTVTLTATSAGSINSRVNTVTLLTQDTTSGGRINSYTLSSSNITASATEGASLTYYANTVTNFQAFANRGATISVFPANNVNLGATNGGFILGAPPEGTTNGVSNGDGLIFGIVQVSNIAYRAVASFVETNGSANTNYVWNIFQAMEWVYVTNNLSLTNFTSVGTNRGINSVRFFVPQLINRTVVYPAFGAPTLGIRVFTNANSQPWGTFTAGVVYAVSTTWHDTNATLSVTEWK